MTVRMLLLGDLGARHGREHVIELAPDLTVQALREQLVDRFADPGIAQTAVRVVVDQVVVSEGAALGPCSEIALLPVVSGG